MGPHRISEQARVGAKGTSQGGGGRWEGRLAGARGGQRGDTGASTHTCTHPQAHPHPDPDSPSQVSLKYCGFSMMWPRSPEPLPSVGDKELPPNVMKCRDMASPSSGASTAAPGEETQPWGGVPAQLCALAPGGCAVPGNPTSRLEGEERRAEGASQPAGEGEALWPLSVWLLSNPRPRGPPENSPATPLQSSDLPDPLSV